MHNENLKKLHFFNIQFFRIFAGRLHRQNALLPDNWKLHIPGTISCATVMEWSCQVQFCVSTVHLAVQGGVEVVLTSETELLGPGFHNSHTRRMDLHPSLWQMASHCVRFSFSRRSHQSAKSDGCRNGLLGATLCPRAIWTPLADGGGVRTPSSSGVGHQGVSKGSGGPAGRLERPPSGWGMVRARLPGPINQSAG